MAPFALSAWLLVAATLDLDRREAEEAGKEAREDRSVLDVVCVPGPVLVEPDEPARLLSNASPDIRTSCCRHLCCLRAASIAR